MPRSRSLAATAQIRSPCCVAVPKPGAGNLTFEVSVLEGSLSGSSGPAVLFIDLGAYNYWHAPVYHGSWYAGARATNDPGLYYNPNSIDCTSPPAQAEGFC